jgi:formate-dependent nitrite reductase membrane component NrfD
MIFDSLVANVPVLKSAVVTLDVLNTQVVWGWIIVMNMWAKSITTGVFLVGIYMLKKFPERSNFYKPIIPVVGLVFVGITLFFTVIDLHKPFRAAYIFLHSHFTSAITWGAWFINIYSLILILMFWAYIKKDDKLLEKLIIPGIIVALLTTVYTAGLMGLSTAREIWQTPTEIIQMVLAAGIGGSASLLLIGSFTMSEEEKKNLGIVLAYSTAASLVIYLSELIFAPTKSEEAEWVVHYLTSGMMAVYFFAGLVIAFLAPSALAFCSAKFNNTKMLLPAAVLSLVGLWMVKHAWLIAPQMIPLS